MMNAKSHISTRNFFAFTLYLNCPLLSSMFSSPTRPYSPKDISCHNKPCYDNCAGVLPTFDKNLSVPNKTIFFIETSCNGGLQSKYACAVESAANANRNWHVMVLFAGPLKAKFLKSKTYKLLMTIPNLYFYRLNSSELAIGTPLQEIFLGNSLARSKHPVVHAADLLRILILYLFGGLYLDLDMIVMQSFDTLPKNFIARQDTNTVIASGIIAVSKDEVGRKFANLAIRNLAETYDVNLWSEGTTELNSRTLKEMCPTSQIREMNAENCQGFHVLGYEGFYPIHWVNWHKYYAQEGRVPKPLDTQAYTHHVWNSFGRQIKLAPKSLFSILAETYCPQTYYLYQDKFGS